MITVRLYTGEVLEFPDGTPEAVMRRAAEKVTSGEFDRRRQAQRNADGTMDLSNLRREPGTFDLSHVRWSGGTDGQPVPTPAPKAAPPSMLTLEEKRRQMAIARERGDLGAMDDPYAGRSSVVVAARQVLPRIKENLIAQVEAPSLARAVTMPTLGPLLGPPAARALDRVLPEALRGRTPAPLEEMRRGAAEDVERAKEELRESMAVRGAPPLATAATQFGFGAEAMALDPLNLVGGGVGMRAGRAGREVAEEVAGAVAPRLARTSEFDDLARASLDIGTSPQTAQIPVQVVDAGSEGVIRRIAALDDAGNEVGSMTYSAEPTGGFRVMDIGTGVRGSGAGRAMMRHASQDANGPYLGSFAETDEGAGFLGRLRETDPDIFPEQSVALLPDESTQMARVAAAEREEFLRPPLPFKPTERGSIGPPEPPASTPTPVPASLPSDIPEHLRPQLPEEQAAEAMGWKIPEGSPRAVGPSTRLPEFQTNIPAQLGDDPQITDYVTQRSDEVFARIGPPQTWDTLEEMAARLGTTKDEFLTRSSHWSVLAPEARLRLLYVIKGNETDIANLQSKLVSGAATDADKAELLRMIDTREDLIKLGAQTGSAYGRALNSLRMEARLALGDDQLLRQQLYRQYSKQLDAEKPLMSVLARLDPNKPEELQAFLRAVNQPKWYEYAHEFWVSSILSTPASHLRNLIGNSVNAVMENAVVRPLSAGFDAARMVPAAEREIFLRETPAAAVGLTLGVRQGLRRGLEVLRRGYDPIAMQGKLFPVRSAFARSQNRVVREVIGPVVTMPLRMLAASDALFKTMNWTADIYAQAARIASKEGLSGESFAARTAELIGNPTDEMIEAADAFALKATFNDPASALGKAIINLRDLPGVSSTNPGLQAGIETYRAGMGFILPFVKIADRLMVRGFEYTPLGAVPAIGARRAGNFAEAADLAARSSVGSAILAYAASLAMEGRLTAGAPTDEAERAAFHGANKQAWSARTDDGVWIPFAGLQPIGTPFALAAAAWKGWQEHGDAPTTEALGHAAAQIGAYVTDQSYMDGLAKFMDAIAGSESERGRAFSDLATNTAWGFVPYSGLTRSVARAIDPRVIDAETIADRLKQNVPGLSLGMDARLTPWGEEVVPTGGRLRPILPPGSVLLPSQERPDPFDQELMRLGIPLGYVGKTIADKFPEDHSSRGQWKLSNKEQHLYQKVAGRTTRLMLGVLFNEMPEYQSWDIESQRDEVQKVIDASRKYARILMVRYRRGQGMPDATPTWEEVSSELELGAGELY